jgi:hypothetical protein
MESSDELYQSRVSRDKLLCNISRELSPTTLHVQHYTVRDETESSEYYPKIEVPSLPAQAHRELKRGRDPIATFRRWLRLLEIAAAVQQLQARRAFAQQRTAIRWLPTLA